MAVVSHTHPSLSKGGAEIAAYAVFRGLRNLGIEEYRAERDARAG